MLASVVEAPLMRAAELRLKRLYEPLPLQEEEEKPEEKLEAGDEISGIFKKSCLFLQRTTWCFNSVSIVQSIE